MLRVGVESDRADEGVTDVDPVGELTALGRDRQVDEGARVPGSVRPVDPSEPRSQAFAVPIDRLEDDERILGNEEADGGTFAEVDAFGDLGVSVMRSSMAPMMPRLVRGRSELDQIS